MALYKHCHNKSPNRNVKEEQEQQQICWKVIMFILFIIDCVAGLVRVQDDHLTESRHKVHGGQARKQTLQWTPVVTSNYLITVVLC